MRDTGSPQSACPLGGGTWIWKRLFPSVQQTAFWLVGWMGIEFVVVVVALSMDPAWERALLAQSKNPLWREVAERISYWGDFFPGVFLVVLVLWIGAFVGHRKHWRERAYAILVAATLAGLSADLLRIVLGRPRTDATVKACLQELGTLPRPWLVLPTPSPPGRLTDGLYGWQGKDLFHSLPSGHAASASATATVLSIEWPSLLPFWMCGAASVLWSRAVLGRHRFSDLVAGMVLGLAFGLRVAPRTSRGTLVKGHRSRREE